MKRVLDLCLALVAAATPLTTGSAQSPMPGLKLWGRLGTTETSLFDTNGNVVHTWQSRFRPGTANYLADDGTLYRAIYTDTPTTLNGAGGGIQRVTLDGTVIWDFRYDGPGVLSHHDFEILPNGNLIMMAWEDKTITEAIRAGRDPGLLTVPAFRPDQLIEVRPTGPTSGEIVWRWHVWDHLIQDFDPNQENYGVVSEHPELIDVNFPPLTPPSGDWNHMNSVDYDADRDWLLLSPRGQHEIWIIDHSTTTEEAAGHTGGRWGKGGDLLYRWGNPAAYQRGTVQDQQLFAQHSPRFIPDGYRGAGNVLVFNNGAGNPGSSSVDEIVLPLDPQDNFILDPNGVFGPAAPVWTYSDPTFGSNFVSSCERLENGNTLICSGVQGWVFEIDAVGNIVWETSVPPFLFHAHHVDRTLWTDATELSISNGGDVRFDLICGSPHAGQLYVVLGSASGTDPGTLIDGQLLPLNFDGYTTTTLLADNRFPFVDTSGLLDSNGRATASLTIPPATLPPAMAGIRLNHAFVAYDFTLGRFMHASNSTPLLITP